MIPFMGLDGQKIFGWNKIVWVLTMAGAIGLFIGGDLNGHVGATNVGYERVHRVSGMVVGTRRGCFEFCDGLRPAVSEYPL